MVSMISQTCSLINSYKAIPTISLQIIYYCSEVAMSSITYISILNLLCCETRSKCIPYLIHSLVDKTYRVILDSFLYSTFLYM